MQVGTTKDQGLYNKPSAAVHPGPLAYHNTIQYGSTNRHRKKTVSINSTHLRRGLEQFSLLITLKDRLIKRQKGKRKGKRNKEREMREEKEQVLLQDQPNFFALLETEILPSGLSGSV